MTKRDTPPDLDKYRPDEAALAASMNAPVDYNRNVDPKLRERLRELNRLSANPGAAPPSEVVVYVPPTELPAASALLSDTRKVELALPPSRNESPTLPSLKRFEGEPEVAAVVKGPSTATPGQAHAGGQRVSGRGAALAVLAVLGLGLLVLILVGSSTGRPERDGTASAPSVTEPAPKQSMPTSATGNATTAASSGAAPPSPASVTPTPSARPSAVPRTPTSAPVPSPTGGPVKQRQRGASEDPYDMAPSATAMPTAVATTVPTAVPSETRPPASKPAPTTSAPAPWFTP
jgi:hypothetical protein